MNSTDKQPEPKKEFEPLEIMGIFWVFFGLVVVISTFFVKATPRIPLSHGIVTNIIAALLLLVIGAFSIIRSRARKRRKSRGQ